MPQITPSRYTVECSWDDVPHLDERTKRELLESYQPHMREARTQGIPHLGAGAIFPVALRQILIDPFPLPEFWPRGYSLDVGWRRTAALFGSFDRNTSTLYVYGEYYQAQQPPSVHADGIKARGDWLPGIIDPSANRRESDGKRLMQDYINIHKLHLTAANNEVDAGLELTYQRLLAGRIKVFRNLVNFQNEYRYYRRDEKGRIVKENDHLMDCLRYMVLSNYGYFKIRPVQEADLGPAPTGDTLVGY
jgi:hypothetical protein